MRLTTLLLVLVLSAATAALYANGTGTTPPSETEETTPAVTVPETTAPGMETTTPTPPTGAGPTTPVAPVVTTTPAMSMEVETFNTNFVASAFGIDRASIMALRQTGWSWGDIYLLANISDLSGRSVLDVAGMRSQGQSYSAIAAQLNLTTAQITSPAVVETRVAGFVAEYGFEPLYYQTDPWGNPVLTRYDAKRLERMGYDWQSIAIAANIAAQTGASVSSVLAWIDRGYTWPQVARIYGVNPKRVMDVSRYPFAREGGATMMAPAATTAVPTARRHRRRGGAVTTAPPPAGAGPMEPGTMGPSTPPNY